MEDPCKKCLVRVTCSEQCDAKRNYTTLLSNAIRNFGSSDISGSKLLKQQQNYYHDLDNKDRKSKMKIYNRSRTIFK